MSIRNSLSIAVFMSLAPIAALSAQPGGPTPAKPVSAAQRHAIVETLATQLKANYVFPEVAEAVASALKAREASGAYAAATTPEAFATALTTVLREIGKDSHFVVDFAPGAPPPTGLSSVPTAAEQAQSRAQAASFFYGFDSIQRLPGNVGYIELRGFGPTEAVGEAYTSAMQLLAGTDALILDLRRNGGGEPNSVAHLLSHFFAEGDERHLNDIYTRPTDSTRQFWTSPNVKVRYTKPVYVLTSARTFSGGEECAYDFQTQKRATLVGETTRGGANPGGPVLLGEGFMAFIPTGKSINPITHSNWEHIGVKPDIAVAPEKAQKTAYMEILRKFIADAKDPEERAGLQELLGKVETDQMDKPTYTLRH